jgi:hypothetical protein
MRPTSISAQIKAAPRMSEKRARVYRYLVDRMERGATDQEMQAALKMSGDTLRPTRGKLLKDGLIYDSGKTRTNENGNDCIVWVVSTISQTGLF